jgi:hypothetical protein
MKSPKPAPFEKTENGFGSFLSMNSYNVSVVAVSSLVGYILGMNF